MPAPDLMFRESVVVPVLVEEDDVEEELAEDDVEAVEDAEAAEDVADPRFT